MAESCRRALSEIISVYWTVMSLYMSLLYGTRGTLLSIDGGDSVSAASPPCPLRPKMPLSSASSVFPGSSWITHPFRNAQRFKVRPCPCATSSCIGSCAAFVMRAPRLPSLCDLSPSRLPCCRELTSPGLLPRVNAESGGC